MARPWYQEKSYANGSFNRNYAIVLAIVVEIKIEKCGLFNRPVRLSPIMMHCNAGARCDRKRAIKNLLSDLADLADLSCFG